MPDPEFDPYTPPKAPITSPKSHRTWVTEPARGNPWLTMWIRPRGTIRAIVDADPNRSAILLPCLFGLSVGLNEEVQVRSARNSLATAVIVSLVFGSVLGLLWNGIGAVLARRTGRWLGGRATWNECRAAIAWGWVPCIAIPFLILGLVVAFGARPFDPSGLDRHTIGVRRLVVLAYRLSLWVVAIWSATLIIRAIAEVHRFSSWRALASIVLGFVFVYGVVLLAFGLVYGLLRAFHLY